MIVRTVKFAACGFDRKRAEALAARHHATLVGWNDEDPECPTAWFDVSSNEDARALLDAMDYIVNDSDLGAHVVEDVPVEYRIAAEA